MENVYSCQFIWSILEKMQSLVVFEYTFVSSVRRPVVLFVPLCRTESHLLCRYSLLLCVYTFQFPPAVSTFYFHLAGFFFEVALLSFSLFCDVWCDEHILQLPLGPTREHYWHHLEAADLLYVWAAFPHVWWSVITVLLPGRWMNRELWALIFSLISWLPGSVESAKSCFCVWSWRLSLIDNLGH